MLEGWTAKDGRLPVNPVGRTEGEGPSDRRHRRVDARDRGDAAHRAGGRHAAAEGRPRAACSTWAARRSPTTSPSWSRCGERTDPAPTQPRRQPAAARPRGAFPDRAGADLGRPASGPGREIARRACAPPPARWRRAASARATASWCTRATRNAMFETMWAAWMLGAVWVPTNFRLTPPEVAYLARILRRSGAYLRRGFPEHAAAAARGQSGAAAAASRIGGAASDWEALATPHQPLARTGGRRSRPSLLVLLHLRHHRAAEGGGADARPDGCSSSPIIYADLMPGTTEHDVSLVVAPLSHGAGIHALTQVRARRGERAAARRAARLRGSVAAGRAASRDQHVHGADDPDHADARRRRSTGTITPRCAT